MPEIPKNSSESDEWLVNLTCQNMTYIKTVLIYMRAWWNWHTHMVQVHGFGGSNPFVRTNFFMKFVGTSFFISFYLVKCDYINVINVVVLFSRIIANMMLNYIISYKYRYAYETRWSSNCTVTVLKIYFVCTVFVFLFVKKRTILSSPLTPVRYSFFVLLIRVYIYECCFYIGVSS